MRPGMITKRGTAKEIAEHAEGYTANGEGEFSRRAANAGVKLASGGPMKRHGTKALERLRQEVATSIKFWEAELRIEDSKARRAKIAITLEKKRQALDGIKRDMEMTR